MIPSLKLPSDISAESLPRQLILSSAIQEDNVNIFYKPLRTCTSTTRTRPTLMTLPYSYHLFYTISEVIIFQVEKLLDKVSKTPNTKPSCFFKTAQQLRLCKYFDNSTLSASLSTIRLEAAPQDQGVYRLSTRREPRRSSYDVTMKQFPIESASSKNINFLYSPVTSDLELKYLS